MTNPPPMRTVHSSDATFSPKAGPSRQRENPSDQPVCDEPRGRWPVGSEPHAGDQCVWVLRRHNRITLQQAHAVVEVDERAGVAWTSCGLALQQHEIADVPAG